MKDLHVLIMAAGKGTRMKSAIPKVLHKVAGKPILEFVLRAAVGLNPKIITVIVGHEAGKVEAEFTGFTYEHKGTEIEFILQKEQRGTGDAVASAADAYKNRDGNLLILSGDTPLIWTGMLAEFRSHHESTKSDLSVMSMLLEDPSGYGRVLKDDEITIRKIVEHKDATADERSIPEVNSGIYMTDVRKCFERLDRLNKDNAQGEYYLTDLVDIFRKDGLLATAYCWYDYLDLLGVNDRSQLSIADKILNIRKIEELMSEGVTIYDPDNTYIEADVEIGEDTTIFPGVVLRGKTKIGKNCEINHFCRLTDVEVKDRTVVDAFSILEESTVGSGCAIGPFSRLRPGNKIGNNCKVGNFVEMKKTSLGNGTKASHLTYLGDSEVGEKVNVGAGTITCNYDGWLKHKTEIGDGAFIGSNTEIVAPVKIGKGAVTGAGTTVTDDIPDNALAVSRVDQKNVPGWAEKKRKKMENQLKKKD